MPADRASQPPGVDSPDWLQGYPLWLCFRALPALVLGALALLLLSINPARAQPEQAVHPNGVQSGQMLFHDRASGHYTAAVMQDSRVHFDISGMLARVQLEQTFENRTDGWVEAVYAFPLPDSAAVKAMEMRIGERRILGQIKEKSLAREIYHKARKAGKKTSLVEQQRPNLFTNRVANIAAGERITVRLEYVQPVVYSRGEFSLRFPMTITPRYIPGAPLESGPEAMPHGELELNPYLGWASATDQVADAQAITPLLHPGGGASPVNAIEITALLDVGMPLANVESPYHELAVTRSSNRYHLRLARGFSEMDRDFVLTWRPVTGAAPQAAVFTEEVDGEHYGLLMVIPPVLASANTAAELPRETVFVIDTSGSMGGVAIEQARDSLSRALNQLHPGDFFNIIEFNSSHRALYPRAVPASRHNVQRAQEYVRHLEAGGGTEMLSALRAALGAGKPRGSEGGATVRQVVFITDGAVGNEQELYREITRHLGDQRLFTVGIGSAPNSWFMRKSAQFGRGSHLHIGDLAEVGEKMTQLFEQISSPLVADISLSWPVAIDSYPRRVPDLYKGEPLVVAVKSGKTPLSGEVTVRGKMAGESWSRQLQLNTASGKEANSGVGHAGVASLWARQKIASLLDELVTGAAEADVRAKVLEVALAHSLLSPYTSFVALEERISRPGSVALAKKPVPNSPPRGQSPQSFAYPIGATTGPANLFIGTFLVFIALMVFVMRREEVDFVPKDQE
jgi:Ca-activated chloride channel homolog